MATEDLDLILDSEFNNTGDLIGLDMELNGGEMLGKLRRLSPIKRFQVLRKLTKRSFPSRGSRREMEKHFKSIPKRVRAQLAAGKMRLGDFSIYSVKEVNSKTTKLFESQDDKEVSLRNVSNAKLPKNAVVMVHKVQVLAGVAPAATAGSPTNDEIKATSFNSIFAYPALVNGEWSLKANKTLLVPEHNSMQRFYTDHNNTIEIGTYVLDNPRPIHDDVDIEFTIELGTMLNIPTDLFVRVELIGTITTP